MKDSVYRMAVLQLPRAPSLLSSQFGGEANVEAGKDAMSRAARLSTSRRRRSCVRCGLLSTPALDAKEQLVELRDSSGQQLRNDGQRSGIVSNKIMSLHYKMPTDNNVRQLDLNSVKCCSERLLLGVLHGLLAEAFIRHSLETCSRQAQGGHAAMPLQEKWLEHVHSSEHTAKV